MTHKLIYFFCAAGSVIAFVITVAPGPAFGATCEQKSPSSRFHYKSQAVCELEPFPPFFKMALPDGPGEWILKEAAAWQVEGHLVSESIALKEKTSKGTYAVKGEIGGTKTKITCTVVTVLSGHLEAEGTITASIDLSECTVNEPSSCKVEQPIKLRTLKGELPTTKGIEFYPNEGEVVAELTYAGTSCTPKGTHQLTGGQACELDSSIETEGVVHSFSCGTSGSNLRLACEKAAFEATAIDLELEAEKKYQSTPN